MEIEVSKKVLKRRRQRLRQKLKALEIKNSLKENHLDQPESKQEETMNNSSEKSKEQVLAERKAKKTVKQQVKKDPTSSVPVQVNNGVPEVKSSLNLKPAVKVEKSSQVVQSEKIQDIEKDRNQVQSEREARKLVKQAAKKKVDNPIVDKVIQSKPAVVKNVQQSPAVNKVTQPMPSTNKPESKVIVSKVISENELAVKIEKLQVNDDGKAKPATKAERRAIQEAQRAAKAKALEGKNVIKSTDIKANETSAKKKPQDTKSSQPSATPQKSVNSSAPKASALHKVKLFKHLYSDKCNLNINVNQKLHPAIIKVGLQYANDTIVGSNARCYAFINAMKILINDYITPPEKFFDRGLEADIQSSVEFLQTCRPFAVSMTNALKYIKCIISQENSNDSDEDKKLRLIERIDLYAKDQIETAAKSISLKVREKISNGDVILTYGCSSLIKKTLVEAFQISKVKFKVVVVDSRPDHEGQEMLKSLTTLGINCTYVLINAVTFIMPEVTKVLLGAHALLANGYVMSRVGTAQIALIANSYNVPVLVCCETHKFSERVQTDAFVYNEIGDPNALVMNKNSRETFEHLKDWESIPHLTPLNLRYDITPPELVTAVVTEVAILPCTSVQVILRVRPAE